MIPRPYVNGLVLALSCGAAIFLGSHLVLLSVPMLALAAAAALVLLWVVLAGDYWWTPVLTGATLTGVFWVGFKVYPLDISVALALAALGTRLLLRGERLVLSNRPPLPLIFYAAAIFITVRMMIDILPVHEGRGNLSRIYFNAIWPFVFAWVFHYFGRPWVLRAGLIAAFLFLLARAAGAVAGWILDVPLYIPGINYVLSFSGRDSLVPMRGVAYNLLLIALIFFHGFRSSVARNAMLPVMAASSWLIVMGASRFTTFLFLVLPVCFFAWTRRWVLLAVATLLSTGAAIYVNVNPRAVDELPPAIARSLSGLEVGKTASEAQAGAEGSNEWHSSLRAEGYKRWTQSPLTFLFGYGVRPSPDLYETKQFSIDPQEVVGIAANTGSYESSLWAVLAILGVVGYAFYFFLSLHFWRKLLPIFLQRPRGTITEGVIFWATYSSVMWFVTGYFQGGFPAMETFLLVLATDVIADQRALARRHESAEVPALPQEVLA